MMLHFLHFLVAKANILAGAGILGISIAGLCATYLGFGFSTQAELMSAGVGMALVGAELYRVRHK